VALRRTLVVLIQSPTVARDIFSRATFFNSEPAQQAKAKDRGRQPLGALEPRKCGAREAGVSGDEITCPDPMEFFKAPRKFCFQRAKLCFFL